MTGEVVSLGFFEWFAGILIGAQILVISGLMLRVWNHESRLTKAEHFIANDPEVDDLHMKIVVGTIQNLMSQLEIKMKEHFNAILEARRVSIEGTIRTMGREVVEAVERKTNGQD